MAEEENKMEIKEEGASLASFDPSKKNKKKRIAVSGALEPEVTFLSQEKRMKVELEHSEDDKDNNDEDLDHPAGENEGGEGSVDQENSFPWKGTKKTVIANFINICQSIRMHPEDLMKILLKELRTDGALDEQRKLVIKGRFSRKRLMGILRPLVDEYRKTHW